jgi:hypothetical protein
MDAEPSKLDPTRELGQPGDHGDASTTSVSGTNRT